LDEVLNDINFVLPRASDVLLHARRVYLEDAFADAHRSGSTQLFQGGQGSALCSGKTHIRVTGPVSTCSATYTEIHLQGIVLPSFVDFDLTSEFYVRSRKTVSSLPAGSPLGRQPPTWISVSSTGRSQ